MWHIYDSNPVRISEANSQWSQRSLLIMHSRYPGKPPTLISIHSPQHCFLVFLYLTFQTLWIQFITTLFHFFLFLFSIMSIRSFYTLHKPLTTYTEYRHCLISQCFIKLNTPQHSDTIPQCWHEKSPEHFLIKVPRTYLHLQMIKMKQP